MTTLSTVAVWAAIYLGLSGLVFMWRGHRDPDGMASFRNTIVRRGTKIQHLPEDQRERIAHRAELRVDVAVAAVIGLVLTGVVAALWAVLLR